MILNKRERIFNIIKLYCSKPLCDFSINGKYFCSFKDFQLAKKAKCNLEDICKIRKQLCDLGVISCRPDLLGYYLYSINGSGNPYDLNNKNISYMRHRGQNYFTSIDKMLPNRIYPAMK